MAGTLQRLEYYGVGIQYSRRKRKGIRVFYHLDSDWLSIAEIVGKLLKARRGNGGACEETHGPSEGFTYSMYGVSHAGTT